jgi:hypothetical protein
MTGCPKTPNRTRTVGIFISTFNCGVLCGFKEIYGKETLRQTSNFITEVSKSLTEIPDYWTYDNGCNLKRFMTNKKNIIESSPTLELLNKKTLVVDRFHLAGHSLDDSFCRENCDPDLFDEMEKINTSIAEQANFWLSGFKHIMKHMSQNRFKFFLYTILEERNIANLRMKFENF